MEGDSTGEDVENGFRPKISYKMISYVSTLRYYFDDAYGLAEIRLFVDKSC